MADGNVQDVPKWKIALAVGVPVTVGIAALWYYKKKNPGPPGMPGDTPKVPELDRTDVESVTSELSTLTDFIKVRNIY